MRNMSFMLTTEQIRDRTKTVTRRIGWTFLKPGDLIQAVEKCQGLKKGEKMKPLAVLRVVNVRRELLSNLTDGLSPSYGQAECIAEGFPQMSPAEFVAMFCGSHKIEGWDGYPRFRKTFRKCEPSDVVTRIEFEYVDHADGNQGAMEPAQATAASEA